jgi:hypothetical protein
VTGLTSIFELVLYQAAVSKTISNIAYETAAFFCLSLEEILWIKPCFHYDGIR